MNTKTYFSSNLKFDSTINKRYSVDLAMISVDLYILIYIIFINQLIKTTEQIEIGQTKLGKIKSSS